MDADAGTFEQCEPLIQLYYECLAKQGNASCDGYHDACTVRFDAKDACLNGRPPPSGLCPDDFPIDCGDGSCCPSSHPVCTGDGRCGLPGTSDAGAAGSGG
jgi:hypothetical protein